MKFKKPKAQGQGTLFLKLGNKDSIKGVFRGDPYDYRQHWHEGRGWLCTGPHSCPLCKEGKKASFRFRINFIPVDGLSVQPAKIFEQGRTVYDQLGALHEEHPLDQSIVKITRNGEGKETSYTIFPTANGSVDQVLEKKLSQVELLPLEPEAPESDEEEQEVSDAHEEPSFP